MYKILFGGAQCRCYSVYRTYWVGAQYLCQSRVQNSLWSCAVSMLVLRTELTMEVRLIYAIVCTELTVEVHSVYISPVYRNYCGGAQ